MSKRIFALVILVMMLFAMGCNGDNNNGGDGYINEDGDIVNQSGNALEEKNADGDYFFRGIVSSTEDKKHIVMEVIDSKIAFGTYWVLFDNSTVYVNADGSAIEKSDIKVGDTIEVVFSGQVMNSFPPKIFAQKIILK